MFAVIAAMRPGQRAPILARRIRTTYIQRESFSFYVLRVRNLHRIPWKKLRTRLGNSCGRIVLGEGIILPTDTGILSVDDTRLSVALACNGLRELLSERRGNTAGKTAVLIDLNCKHQAFADILVSHYQTVRIVTRRVEWYQNYADRKFYECGAAVLVSSTLAAGEAALYVTPDGVILPGMECAKVPVFMSKPPQAPLSDVKLLVHSFRAPLPQEYLCVFPKGVPEHDFEAALYEYCGQGSLGTLQPSTAIANGIAESMNELKTNLFSLDKN